MTKRIDQVSGSLGGVFMYLENLHKTFVPHPFTAMASDAANKALTKFYQAPRAWTYETLLYMEECQVMVEYKWRELLMNFRFTAGHFLDLDRALTAGHVGMAVKTERLVAFDLLQDAIKAYNAGCMREIYFKVDGDSWIVSRGVIGSIIDTVLKRDPKFIHLKLTYTGQGLMVEELATLPVDHVPV